MSSRRRSGEERLYRPPALRKQNQHQQLKTKSSSSSSPERRRPLKSGSNLNRFLDYTTPVVPAQHFPRSSVQAWRNRKHIFYPYFNLSDLWESFREWSVYGAGVPLVLNGTDSVVQYYVPSLSGIQLYVDPSRNVVEERKPGEESESNSSTSDGDHECSTYRSVDNSQRSCDPESISGRVYTRNSRRNHTHLGTSADGNDSSNSFGLLVFEYFEKELPFHREPLVDKISVLASKFPELKSYRSCDLNPASWICIAWYPIYRIPVGTTLQNVDTCFLTFHFLAKPVESSEGIHDPGSLLSLPTFGLVSHKFKASDWSANGIHEVQKMNSLLQAAGNWLQLLQVNHPDYNFFQFPWYISEIETEIFSFPSNSCSSYYKCGH